MTEHEQEVIEAAIDFINTWDHGIFSDRPKKLTELRRVVRDLLAENEGRWPAEG
jgi:hypothetical protein